MQKEVDDPILILGDAYAKCRVPEVRHDIATAVRQAFRAVGIRDKKDSVLVTKAMQWYREHKKDLVPNCDDDDNALNDEYTRVPLFKRKTTNR